MTTTKLEILRGLGSLSETNRLSKSTECMPIEPAVAEDRNLPMNSRSLIGIVEIMLKRPEELDRLTREEARQPDLILQFLAIALIGFTIFGVAATVMLNAAIAVTESVWPAHIPPATWGDWSLMNLILAYDLGLVAATGIVLPSFYFFGLLAGVSPTMLGVLAHATKGKAVAALTLVGILPIYFAVELGLVVFDISPFWTRFALYGVLALPFVAGLNGVRSLYVGFTALADTLPPHRRCARECLLRRLVAMWAACYTAVTPLMVYTIWCHLS